MNKSALYTALYRWWKENKRELPWRETTDPYRIWLSEVILQQTRVAQGMEYYIRFTNTYPHVGDLAAADEQEVMRLWQGLGYYSRARNLHKAAKMIAGRGELGAENREQGTGSFPRTWEELRKLPGIGDYTAGAIAAFAYNLPHPALDGNVYRVLSRLYDCEIPFDSTEGKKHFRQLAEELLDRENPRLFDSAIMELGALQCLPSAPDCEHCPLVGHCLAHENGTVELLPVRKARPKVTERKMKYIIYLDREKKTLIRRRDSNDIWRGLWEFAAVSPEEETANRDGNLPVKSVRLTHLLSHRKLIAEFCLCPVDVLPETEGMKVVRWEELDEYGMPKLMLNAIKKLGL